MTTKSSKKWAISVCGLNCAVCDMYQAGHGDAKLREEIVEWFRKERDENIKPEEVRCEGCRGPVALHWSPDCKMMLCAKNKEIEHCFQCKDFPCSLLKEFSQDGVAHHKRTVENMEQMKEKGLDAWIENQKKKNQCLFCP